MSFATTQPPCFPLCIQQDIPLKRFTLNATTITVHNNTAPMPPTEQVASPSSITIGTRQSELAMVQARHVQSLLQAAHPSVTFHIHGMTTTGDQILDRALSKIGTKSLFTKELEVALAEGQIDLVVHSLKDLPTTLPPGMTIGAITERVDPRDVMIVKQQIISSTPDAALTLATLPPGSVIGTSSVRRSAQLRHKYPHLAFQDVRGNLNTRLRKLDEPDSPYAALILAYAGIERLGWLSRVTQILDPDTMMYAVGQGALGIECRMGDDRVLRLLQSLDHRLTRLRCLAERTFMRRLEGGCSVPLGVWTSHEAGCLSLDACVTTLDGSRQLRSSRSIPLTSDNDTLLQRGGSVEHELDVEQEEGRLAEQLGVDSACDLIAQGALDILAEIKKSAH